jgi:hypothetical protein
MPIAARADLEALLRVRKLDRTLTTALPQPAIGDERVLATGLAALDGRLGGGVPRGQMSEIVGARSSGRMAVLLSLLAGATRRGEVAAFVDTLDILDPESASACGVDLARLLWVRGEAVSTGVALDAGGGGQVGRTGPLEMRIGVLVDRAIKAFNLVLQAGGFALVALDLAEVPAAVIRRLPFTTWMRLQRIVEGSETACVLLGPAPIARSAGGVTIALARARGAWPRRHGDTELQSRAMSHESRVSAASRVLPAACSNGHRDTEARSRVGPTGYEIEARVIQPRGTRDETPCRIRLVPAETAGGFSAEHAEDAEKALLPPRSLRPLR